MLQAIAIGHLGGDAECKSLNGREFTTFRIAHSNKWTDTDNVTHEETTWVDCIMQGKPNVLQYLKKGQQVYVNGSVSLRIYSSKKDRCMKAGMTINVRSVELLGGKNDEVPSIVYAKDENVGFQVTKCYWCQQLENDGLPGSITEVHSKSGELFEVNPAGFIRPKKAAES